MVRVFDMVGPWYNRGRRGAWDRGSERAADVSVAGEKLKKNTVNCEHGIWPLQLNRDC